MYWTRWLFIPAGHPYTQVLRLCYGVTLASSGRHSKILSRVCRVSDGCKLDTLGFRLYKWCRVRGRVFVLFPFYFWGQRPREAVIYPGSHRILVGESGLTARFSDLPTLLPCLLAVARPCVVLWPCTSILSPVQLSWPWSTSPSSGQWWYAMGFLDLKMIKTPSLISTKGYFIKITETFFPLKPE